MPGGTAGVAASMSARGPVDSAAGAVAARLPPCARPESKARGALTLAWCAAWAFLLCASPAPAASNKVRMTGLTDVSFGTLANLGVDAVHNQSLCLYADTPTNGYSITAMGSGSGGAFDLSSGAQALPFEVAWNSAAGQSSGNQLSPNVPLTGQTSTATQQTCNSGPATSASLVVVLRAAALSSTMAGTYAGTLTLIVGAE
jgi:hypothetical protein